MPCGTVDAMSIADTVTVTYDNGRTETFADVAYRIDRHRLHIRPAGDQERVISRWDVVDFRATRRHRRP